MKSFLKKTAAFISALVILFIIASIFLVFYTRHHLEFDAADKDMDKIVIYGDVRSGYLTHKKIADMIYNEKPDMVLFTGDIASNSRNYIHYLQFALFEKKLWDNAEYSYLKKNYGIMQNITQSVATMNLHTGYMICFLSCLIILHIIHLIEWVCTLLSLNAGTFLIH